MIGWSSKSNRVTVGGSISRGSCARVDSTWARTSSVAFCMLVPMLNCTRVVDAPWVTTEDIDCTSVMPASEFSIWRVTWVFSSCGAAPDWVTVTIATGNSMFG